VTDYGFRRQPAAQGFPAARGFVEVRTTIRKRVVYEPVRLNQEFRNFDFLSPWEGADIPLLPRDEKAESSRDSIRYSPFAIRRLAGTSIMAEPALRNFTINFGPQHPAATACCVWCWS